MAGLPSSLDAALTEAESASYGLPDDLKAQFKKQDELYAQRKKENEQPIEMPALPKNIGKTPGSIPFQSDFIAASQRYGVPINVLMGLAEQESRFNPSALGTQTKWGRAKGLMQYLDSTAAGMGINPYNPTQAIDAAARQLRERLDKGYSMIDAVREHFAGPDRKQWGPKTAAYGNEVMARAARLQGFTPSGQPASAQHSAMPQGSTSQQPGTVEKLNAKEPGRYRALNDSEMQKMQEAQAQGFDVFVPFAGAKPIKIQPAADIKISQPKADQSMLSRFGDALGSGYDNMTRSMGNAVWLVKGGDTTDVAGNIFDNFKQQQEAQANRTPGQKRLDQAIDGVGKADGFLNTLSRGWDAVKVAAQEPGAVFLGAAESAPNMIPSAVGALGGAGTGGAVGAGAGAVAGGVGAAPGAVAGAIWGGRIGLAAGTTAVEAGAELEHMVIDRLQKSKLPVTQANIKKLLDDPKFRSDAQKQGAAKGLTLAAVDALTMGAAGRVLSAPARQAEKKAVRTIIKDTGVDEKAARSLLASPAGRAALEKASPGTLKKATAHVGAFGVELLGEPVGEAVSQAVARGSVDWSDVTGELIYGAGQAAAGTAGAKAIEAGNAAYGQMRNSGAGTVNETAPAADATSEAPADLPAQDVTPAQPQADTVRKGPIERALDDHNDNLRAQIDAELADVNGQPAAEKAETNATLAPDADLWLGEPGTVAQITPKEDPESVYTVTVEGYQNGEVFARDQDGTPMQFGQNDVNVAQVQAPTVENTPAPELTTFEQPTAEEAKPVKAEKIEIEQPKEQPAPKQPEPVKQPERSLADMDEQALRDRLKYLAQQAKTTGGWDKRLMAERRKVEAEINKKQPSASDYIDGSTRWTNMTPDERMAAAEKAGIDAGKVKDLSSQNWESIDIPTMNKIALSLKEPKEAKAPEVKQPEAAAEQSADPSDFEALLLDAHVNNPAKKAQIIANEIKASGRTRGQVFAQVSRIVSDYEANKAPAAVKVAPAAAPVQADTVPVVTETATETREPLKGTDGKTKWFMSKDKAQQFLEKNNLADQYEVKKVNNRRYEIHPTEAKTQDTAPENTKDKSKSAYSLPDSTKSKTDKVLGNRYIGDDWRGHRRDDFQPNERQKQVIDATQKALDDGKYYNEEVENRVAELLNVPQEIRDINLSNVERGDFASDVYHARQYVEKQKGLAEAQQAAQELGLEVGKKIGTVVFDDGKVARNTVVTELNDTQVKLSGTSGNKKFNYTTTPAGLKTAIERAVREGKRKPDAAPSVVETATSVDEVVKNTAAEAESLPAQAENVPAQAENLPADAETLPREKVKPTDIEGKDIGDGWSEFSKDSGTIGVPRTEMPQIKAEHRGAMVNFMNARGIAHQEETVPADSLKPTQAEFSKEKVEKASKREGGDRSILISKDNHVLDGHHQWMAAREAGQDVKVIRLDALIKDLIEAAHEFPSSTMDDTQSKDETAPQVTPSERVDRPALPERYNVGPFTGKTKPINKTLYREMDAEGLNDLVRVTLTNGGGDLTRVFVTDNIDLALGQGKNKGILVQMRGDVVSGEEHYKPGTGDLTGREYQTDFIGVDAIDQIHVPKGTKLRVFTRQLIQSRFERKNLDDGSVLFTRKGVDTGQPLNEMRMDYAAPDTRFSRDEQPKNLFVAHNLSASNILAANDLGGLAAPSIAVARSDVSDFSGFGEVTLLADPKLLEDSKIRTFDADIYSPRQPRANYELDQKKFNAFVNELDQDGYGLRTPGYDDASSTDGAEAFIRSDAVKYKYLQEIGKAPKPKNAKVDPAIKAAAKLEGSRWNLPENPKFVAIATKHYKALVEKYTAASEARGLRMQDVYFNEDGKIQDSILRDFATKVDSYRSSGGKDISQLRSDINEKMRNDKLRTAFEKWATDQFNSMVTGKTLFKGFTNAGNRRYQAYTLENVVKEMTEKLQAGEGTFYGAGSVRSAYTNEMKTLKDIQSRRDQIVTASDMERIKEESGKVFSDALENLKPFYKYDSNSWGYMDDAGSAIAEGQKGIREAFRVTPESRKIIADLTSYLANLPTAYFEAKAQRAVQFGEFNTAVVPKGMNKDALQVLRDSGLKIKTYDPKVEGDRARVIAQQEKLLFSQGEQKGTGTTIADVRHRLVERFGKDTITRLEDQGILSIDDRFHIPGVEGYSQNGNITLVASNLTADTIVPVFLHELGGHVGMQGVMKPNAYKNLMDQFNRLVAAKDPVALEAKRLAERETDPDARKDEYLPYLITVAARAQSKRPGITTLVNRIVSAVKAWAVEKLGVNINLNANDVLALAERMVNAVSNTNVADGKQRNSRIDAPQSEIDAVRQEYEGTAQWMNAPNGEPTNLDEQQWLQVRTPSFKNWFGDWENDPENSSKVIDENGEPLVVYHGTGSEFTVFEMQDGAIGTGAYFSSVFEEAADYAAGKLDEELSDDNDHGGDWIGTYIQEVFLNVRDEDNITSSGYGNGGNIYLATSPNQIKSATDNTGTFDTDNPDIRFSRKDDDTSPVSEEEYASKLSQWWDDLKKLPRYKMTNIIKNGGLGFVPLRPMLNELAKDLPSAKNYLRIKDKMDAMRNEWHSKTDEVAQKWLKYRIKNREENRQLMDIMHESTLAQVDPSMPFQRSTTPKEITSLENPGLNANLRAEIMEKIKRDGEREAAYDELKSRFDDLSADAQAVYADVREAYKDLADAYDKVLLDNMEKAINVRVNKAEREHKREMERITDEGLEGEAKEKAIADAERKLKNAKTKISWNRKARLTQLRMQFETQRLAGPYFPLARFGDLFVTVRDAKTGEVVSFSRFDDAKEQNDFAKEMKKDQNYKVEMGALSDAAVTRKAVDPNFVADVEDILADLPNAEQVKDEVWQRYLESLPDMSTRKARIHRKGRAGYTADAVRAFGHHLFHGSHQLARMKYSMDLEDVLDQARDDARETEDPTRSSLLVNELEKRHQFVMNPTSGSWTTWASSFAFLWYLAGSPKAAIMNLFQTPIMGVPILGAYAGGLNGIARAGKQLSLAMVDFTKGKGFAERSSGLNSDERDAMQKGYETGIIEKTQGHELAGVAETGVEYNAVRERAMRLLSWGFHHTERLNREITFLAGYRLARQKGESHEQAITTAGDLTWKTHFDYGNTSRPRFMQHDVLKVLLVFRNFQVNMLFRLFRDIHQAATGETKEVRREAFTQLAGITGMMMLNAGLTGTWLFGIAMVMAGLFTDDGDDPEEELKKAMVSAIGPRMTGMVLHGLPGYVTGTSLSGSVGMPDLWFRSPDSEKEADETMQYYLEQMLGAVPAIAMQAGRGLKYIGKGEVYRGIETMMPKMLKDPMKAYRFGTDGAKNMRGDTVTDVTFSDVVKQALGFTPARIAEQYKTNNASYNKQQAILKERKQLMDTFYKADKDGDNEKFDELMAKIDKYNEKYPDQAITGRSLIQSRKTRDRGADKAVGGMRYNSKLRERLLEEQSPSIYDE